MPGKVLWLTGLSGAGKTTLVRGLEARLKSLGAPCLVLDGDVLRRGLCSDLTLTAEHRNENVRRASEVAALFSSADHTVLCAFMSPYRKGRKSAKESVEKAGGEFLEVHVSCPVKECRKRDPKGLYAKFDRGEIKWMVGIDMVYEAPSEPALVLPTHKMREEECIDALMSLLVSRR